MADHYRLRPASRADAPALAALEAASFPDPWSVEQLLTALDDEAVRGMIAESPSGGVVGYAISRTVADEGELLSVTAAPGVRRRGIGGLLLDDALAGMRAAGAATAWLEVRESNRAAQALYRRAGFVVTGSRRRYYQHPVEDALLLRCDLRPHGPAASSGHEAR